MKPCFPVRIHQIQQPEFLQFWEIYQTSFPEAERKTAQTMELALQKKQFYLWLYFQHAKPMGFAAYWCYPRFCYVEYLAVVPSEKGQGWGTLWMETLKKEMPQPLILEIEHPTDAPSMRRKAFYGRLGFAANTHLHHFQPPYQKSFQPLSMELLSYPKLLSQTEYDDFNQILTTEMIQLV